MRAIWNNTVIAETYDNGLVIENNHYFPPNAIKEEYFEKSDHTTECPWKGTAHYYHVVVDGKRNENAAWYYPEPKDGSIEKVGADFSNYVAFWNGVEVTD